MRFSTSLLEVLPGEASIQQTQGQFLRSRASLLQAGQVFRRQKGSTWRSKYPADPGPASQVPDKPAPGRPSLQETERFYTKINALTVPQSYFKKDLSRQQ
jgi:hypothetical protein